MASSFGTFLIQLFGGIFGTASQQSFLLLAYGWVCAHRRHTIANYIWLSGGVLWKHFSRFYVFLGRPFYQKRHLFFARILLAIDERLPDDQVLQILFDDVTKKKAGPDIQGRDRYRNQAGSARQEYRVLQGINLVHALALVPLPWWPGHHLAVPIGLELYLKAAKAQQLEKPYHSRSALARQILDFAAETLPHRKILACGDGDYATQTFLPKRPANVQVVSRLLISGVLYERPTPPPKGRRGPKPKKGKRLGSPKQLAQTATGWQAHPSEAGAEIQSWVGLWHTVLPGEPIRVVVVRRPAGKRNKRTVEAFFSTDLTLSVEQILAHYDQRWDIEIDIRDSNQYHGLGQDQCRKYERIVGANSLRWVLAAARTLWFIEQVEQSGPLDLLGFRPWYRKKEAPSQLDVLWLCQEVLWADGIKPIPRYLPGLAIIPADLDHHLKRVG